MYRLIDRSIDWLIDWLFDDWLIDWLIGWLFEDWLIDWLIGWLFEDWLIDLMLWLVVSTSLRQRKNRSDHIFLVDRPTGRFRPMTRPTFSTNRWKPPFRPPTWSTSPQTVSTFGGWTLSQRISRTRAWRRFLPLIHGTKPSAQKQKLRAFDLIIDWLIDWILMDFSTAISATYSAALSLGNLLPPPPVQCGILLIPSLQFWFQSCPFFRVEKRGGIFVSTKAMSSAVAVFPWIFLCRKVWWCSTFFSSFSNSFPAFFSFAAVLFVGYRVRKSVIEISTRCWPNVVQRLKKWLQVLHVTFERLWILAMETFPPLRFLNKIFILKN